MLRLELVRRAISTKLPRFRGSPPRPLHAAPLRTATPAPAVPRQPPPVVRRRPPGAPFPGRLLLLWGLLRPYGLLSNLTSVGAASSVPWNAPRGYPAPVPYGARIVLPQRVARRLGW